MHLLTATSRRIYERDDSSLDRLGQAVPSVKDHDEICWVLPAGIGLTQSRHPCGHLGTIDLP